MNSYVEIPDINNMELDGLDLLNKAFPSFNFSDFVDSITNGTASFQADNILKTILGIFAEEMYSSLRILAVIIAIVMLSAVLENLRVSFGKNKVMNTEIIVTALLSGLAGEIFAMCGTYAGELTNDVTKLMWAILPVMLVLTAGSGFVQSGVMVHPVLYFMCNVFAEMFNKILIPLSVGYLAVSLADLITDTIKLDKLRELIRKCYNFIMGLIMTFFTGLLTISKFAGISLDSVGAKGIKFAISNMVPVVGGSISDAMSAVASASVLLKNAVGITGIVSMLALCVIPILKVAAVIFSIRISAAVCEPVASSKTIQILTAAADSLSMINTASALTVVMMIISLGILVGIK